MSIVSVIICSKDEAKLARTTQSYEHLLAATTHEIIPMRSPPSLAAAYNSASRSARGDILVFAHDDVEIISPDFAGRLITHLQTNDVIGVAGTTRLVSPIWSAAGPPYICGQVAHALAPEPGYVLDLYGVGRRVVERVQALDGLFLAATAAAFKTVQFDEARFDGFHLYDVDFSYSAHLRGLKVAVCTDINVIHNSGGNFDDAWARYARRFVEKHGPAVNQTITRKFVWGGAAVQTRDELMELMRYAGGSDSMQSR